MEEDEYKARMQRMVSAARMMERSRLLGTLQDYCDAALGDGEIAIAERLALIIEAVRGAIPGDERLEAEAVGMYDEDAERQREKAEFDRELTGSELPRVQFNSDEDDAARLLRANPRMAPPAFDIARD